MSTDKQNIKEITEKIRFVRSYHWVGIYKVTDSEITTITWTGSESPTHPRFPIAQGLCGAAVKTKKPVIVGDVKKDSRYLTTFSDTRSEIVVPISNGSGDMIALINVASNHLNAFDSKDVQFLEGFSSEILSILQNSMRKI